MANYTYAFDSGVYDTTKMGNPAPINTGADAAGRGGLLPLSALNNSFALVSAGKINHEDVEGVLFNYVNVGSAAPVDQDFYLQSPGGPDHPDSKAIAGIALSATPTGATNSMIRFQSTNGNLSSLFAVASGVQPGNTGWAHLVGTAFFCNTGSDVQVLESIGDVLNFHGSDGAFTVEINKQFENMILEQNTAGDAGNTNIAVSGTAVIDVLTDGFVGGADEQSDATHIRAAAGTNTTQGYDGHTVAVVTTTGRTVTYDISHGTPGTAAVLSGFNLATGPNMRRDVLLGYR